MKKSVIWIGASLVSIVVIFVVINAVNFQTDEPAEVQRLQSATPASQVEEGFGLEKDWQKNGADNLYTTRLLEGELASERTGVILTDTDCEADAQGISQCHNKIELDPNHTITVMNIHNMMNYECFSPGEKVKIVPSEDGEWMVLSKIES
ncbi:hypothetical protein NDS46_14440 [Paenibacillus thiaminolyticus]|uniref:hypothetical protein n=1 Tax=Paenibacillus thiaminolyticus TaxID=49283 RepID=UPI00232C1664|nr:hypothetical protein [Paenibacillus thiaminolyticus]WCF10966.1 hypothetical protein NDS46_14440 [Paenibacillus thiaminolyticus]